MKAALKAGLKAVGLYEPASRAWRIAEPRLLRVTRGITRKNARLVRRNEEAGGVRKLHIGSGDNELKGWLNSELYPRGDQVHLDATRRFPFPDATFGFVYAEHMIEHISLRDADAMLAECRRVLTPGGVIRLVTPDFAFLLTLLEAPPSPSVAGYIRYSIDAHRIYAPDADGLSVFNHFVRGWGHQYIHTEATLRSAMVRAGFADVQRRPLNSSPHPALTGLAKVDRMPPGFLEMESFVLEGTKPDRSG